jgi:steroid 5-alpha reductase family enzyme
LFFTPHNVKFLKGSCHSKCMKPLQIKYCLCNVTTYVKWSAPIHSKIALHLDGQGEANWVQNLWVTAVSLASHGLLITHLHHMYRQGTGKILHLINSWRYSYSYAQRNIKKTNNNNYYYFEITGLWNFSIFMKLYYLFYQQIWPIQTISYRSPIILYWSTNNYIEANICNCVEKKSKKK